MQNQNQAATMTQTSATTYEWSAPYHWGLIGALRDAGGRWNHERHVWTFTIPTENKGTRGRLFAAIGKVFPDYTFIDQTKAAATVPAQPVQQPTAPGMARCEMCGDEVDATLLMTSAHGSVCLRCYELL